MKFYIGTILFFMTGFMIFNHFIYAPIYGFPLWYNIVGVVVSTILVIAIDGIVAGICHALQKKHFEPTDKYFNVSKKEKNLWERLGVKYIKKLVPDLGSFVKFPKGKILEPRSPEYIYVYLKESCSGELGHVFGMFCGFLIILAFPQYWFCFGLPVAIVNFVLSFFPVMVLRHNRHSLNNIYQKLLSRQNAKQKTEDTEEKLTEQSDN